MNSIHIAIDLLGGPAAMSRVLKVTPQAVYFWRDGKRRFAAEYCPSIERATNGAVRCEDLRPDVDWAYIRGSGVIDRTTNGADQCEDLRPDFDLADLRKAV